MVAIATEAWALAGCGAAAQELPVQQLPPAAANRTKKAVSLRGVSSSSGGGQDRREAVVVGRRSGLASCVLAALAASFSPLAADRPARAMVLEADEDIELLERVKDRKKRLQKQGVISSSGTETGLSLRLLALIS